MDLRHFTFFVFTPLLALSCHSGQSPAPTTIPSPELTAEDVSTESETESEHPYEPQPTIPQPTAAVEEFALDVLDRRGDFPALNITALAVKYPIWFGLLHAHTMISDGSGTPEEAFQQAQTKGVDFFAVTPHNHKLAEYGAKIREDGVLIALDHDLYNGSGPQTFIQRPQGAPSKTITTPSLIEAARQATVDGHFVALYGQEFSTISSGNHLNVFGIRDVLTVPNGEFGMLYGQLDSMSPKPVVQMNHPDVHRDFWSTKEENYKRYNDYGFDDYGGDFADLVNAADGVIALVELLSGPALIDKSYSSYHYRHHHEDDYYYYLSQGFHISPSVGHDNHWRRWGDKTPARMGVISNRLTVTQLYAAMHSNHTYATEDADLELRFFCNGELMGTTLTLVKGESVSCTVALVDPSDNADYIAELVWGEVEAQTRSTLRRLQPQELGAPRSRQGDGLIAFADFYASGGPEFVYVRVRQSDSDQAWSAPIWVNHPR